MGELEDNIALLSDRSSGKRRSAAKRLRKMGDPAAGPALFTALQKEVQDPRTWETQYQMIMGVAECGFVEALPFLKSRIRQNASATALNAAIGNAIVRLTHKGKEDASPVLVIMASGDLDMLSGAFQAMAMLRLTPPADQIDAILGFLATYDESSPRTLHFWPAAAAAGWGHHPKVEPFLKACLQSPREDVREAAGLSLKGKYKNWNPL